MSKVNLLAVLGTTASGKTSLAVQLARALNDLVPDTHHFDICETRMSLFFCLFFCRINIGGAWFRI
jgi:uridine kinase